MKKAGNILVAIVSSANLLELGASLPSASTTKIIVHSTIALASLAWILAKAKRTTTWLRSLAMPPAAKVVFLVLLSAQLFHGIFQREYFPFSSIKMFHYVKEFPGTTVTADVTIVTDQDGLSSAFSLAREGDLLFHRFEYLGDKGAYILKRLSKNKNVQRRVDDLLKKAGMTMEPGRWSYDFKTSTETLTPVRISQ